MSDHPAKITIQISEAEREALDDLRERTGKPLTFFGLRMLRQGGLKHLTCHYFAKQRERADVSEIRHQDD